MAVFLFFSRSIGQAIFQDRPGEGLVMQNLKCHGDEATLSACPFDLGSANTGNAVGITCAQPCDEDFTVRLY